MRIYRPPEEDLEEPPRVLLPQSDARHWSALFWPIFIAIVTFMAMAFAGRLFADDRIDALTKYGTPDRDWIAKGDGAYLVSLDGMTGCPKWVLEKIDKNQLAVRVIRDNEEFRADDSIPVEFRVLPDDYRGSGFDKGHMAPAAVHRTSQQDLDSTFILSNAVPQQHAINAGIWRALENEIAGMAETTSVWVVTAPLWIPSDGELRIQTIGRRNVWVPTHCGKAVLVEERQRVDCLRAWVIPNEAQACQGKRFQDFQVRVDEFETRSGLNVFSALPDELEERLEGAAP